MGDLKVSLLGAVQSYLTKYNISVFQHYQREDPVLTSLNVKRIKQENTQGDTFTSVLEVYYFGMIINIKILFSFISNVHLN